MAKKEDILTKTYDLLGYLIPLIAKLPRSHKFTLGDRADNLLLDILEGAIRAYYTGHRSAKIEELRENNLRLETLRYLIRLIHDSVQSWVGHAGFADTWGLRRKLFRETAFVKG